METMSEILTEITECPICDLPGGQHDRDVHRDQRRWFYDDVSYDETYVEVDDDERKNEEEWREE